MKLESAIQCAAPTFTVVIPSYNYERFVTRAIDSVLAQSCQDFELIVVDDGSTDNSWGAITGYGDQLQALRCPNQGAARACLFALRRARGAYVHILDADDEMMPDCLATAKVVLGAGPAKIQFPLTPIDADGAVIGSPFPAFPQHYSRSNMLAEIGRNGTYLTGPTSGIIYRADVLAAIGDVGYESYLDGVAYLLCPFIGDVITIYRPLARYRLHGKNASGFTAPTAEWIAIERDRFVARLAHLRRICALRGLDAAGVPDGRAMPYVLERDILIRLAKSAAPSAALVIRYIRRTATSIAPIRRKLAFSAWAVAAGLAPNRARAALLRWRYNPWSRPRFLRGLSQAIGPAVARRGDRKLKEV